MGGGCVENRIRVERLVGRRGKACKSIHSRQERPVGMMGRERLNQRQSATGNSNVQQDAASGDFGGVIGV